MCIARVRRLKARNLRTRNEDHRASIARCHIETGDGGASSGYYSLMKKASITETKNQLSALLDRVRHGEAVLIMDRGRPVARLEPAVYEGEGNEAGRLARLERAGILRRAISSARSGLLREPPPRSKKGASILQALLAEREPGR